MHSQRQSPPFPCSSLSQGHRPLHFPRSAYSSRHQMQACRYGCCARSSCFARAAVIYLQAYGDDGNDITLSLACAARNTNVEEHYSLAMFPSHPMPSHAPENLGFMMRRPYIAFATFFGCNSPLVLPRSASHFHLSHSSELPPASPPCLVWQTLLAYLSLEPDGNSSSVLS